MKIVIDLLLFEESRIEYVLVDGRGYYYDSLDKNIITQAFALL